MDAAGWMGAHSWQHQPMCELHTVLLNPFAQLYCIDVKLHQQHACNYVAAPHKQCSKAGSCLTCATSSAVLA